ncbi:ubiquitinyl hydrolase 1 [Balamuthia mandrillaris]
MGKLSVNVFISLFLLITFILFYSVLVHSGDVHGGHYYAYIRPGVKNLWYKFDDERVTKAKVKDVFAGCFGGVSKKPFMWNRNSANAYMLLYMRESDRESLLQPVKPEAIPLHLKERMEQEEAEKAAKKKELAEEHLFAKVKVATVKDCKEWLGFDFVNFDQIQSIKYRKESTLGELRQSLAEMHDIPPERIRLWTCPNRRNQTIRPDEPLGEKEMEQTLEKHCKKASELKLFMEVSTAPEGVTDPKDVFAPHIPKEDAIIFIKYYDPSGENATFGFVCYLFVKRSDQLSSLVPILNEKMGFSKDTELILYEEIKTTMIDELKQEDTFISAELDNGDIICFQKVPPKDNNYERPLATDYYAYMRNRTTVKFRSLENYLEDAHVLELEKNMEYDQVVTRLGAVLGVDPMKIRLTQHSRMYGKPRMSPVKRSQNMTLEEMLSTSYARTSLSTDIIYYEILEMSIVELEENKLLKIDWYGNNTQLESSHKILVPKDSTFAAVAEKLKEVVTLKMSGKIRILEIHNNKIYRVLKEEERTIGFNETNSLRAEEIPEEEVKPEKGTKIIQMAHVCFDPPLTQYFGEPFLLAVPKTEKFADTKKRIQAKLEIPEEEFATWKFATVSWLYKPKYVDDECFLAKEIESTDQLGLEHKMPRRARTRRPEIGIKINN